MSVVSRTMYPVGTSMSLISKMQSQFDTLQQQMATGKKAQNLAQLGNDRYFDLSIRSRLSRIEGYGQSVDMVNLRLKVFDQSITSLDDAKSAARSYMTPGAYGSSNLNFGTASELGRNALDQVLTVLNTDVNGRYLFAGSDTDVQPVETTDNILNGVGGKAGFKQVAMERLQADQGTGTGRLNATSAGDTATLTEDGAHPFGFKLSTVSASGSGVTITQPTATAPQFTSIQFNTQPVVGDTVTVGLTLPDGTSDQITLKAVSGVPGAGEFRIGADQTGSATNLKDALTAALTTKSNTTLAAASNNAAADNFFNGQGQPVLRVQGTPSFAAATQLVTADPTNTVIWYKGADNADARGSVQAKVDDTVTVSYGAQANENGTVNLVRGLAVLAVQNFSTSDPNAQGKFDAVASRNIDRLAETHASEPGSIEILGVELNNVAATMKTATDRQTAYSAQLNDMLTKIEQAPDSEVAMEMLALQTRMTASYQATSIISQLSLVNYLK